MKILVANNQLKKVGGSETFTYTLIEELRERNFQVEYFTFYKGLVSEKIENNLKVPFMSSKKFDLVLANHNTCVDKLHKKGFTVQTCHGIFPKLEQPSLKANAYVAISEEVQNHLASLDIPSRLIYNSINLERFRSIKSINNKLKTVLSLCHSEEANDFIKKACIELGINFIKVYKYDEPIWEVENIINDADLVVGLGRSAYEGMACGRPIIVYDKRSYFSSCGDGYLKENLGFSLKNNCSGRYSLKEMNLNDIIQQLLKYNSSDGNYLRTIAEKELNIKINLDKYFDYVNLLQSNRMKRRKEKYLKFSDFLISKRKHFRS